MEHQSYVNLNGNRPLKKQVSVPVLISCFKITPNMLMTPIFVSLD